MITKISISKIACYGDNPAILETDKKINIVYGLNGTGKTTLSNYLADKESPRFNNCYTEGLGNEKVMVYNQSFIEKNFIDRDTQKGIFSLSSTDGKAEIKIKNAEEELKKINLQLRNDELKTGLEFDLNKKNQELETLLNNAQNKTWDIKTTYSGGDRILEFCLAGKKGDRKILFEYISKIKKPESKPEKTIEDLKKEAESTQGSGAQKYDENEIKKIDFNFLEIEEHSVFQDIIVGNENLQIASLIKTLNNSDWVKQGLDYINDPNELEDEADLKNEKCPFCQKETISKKLYDQIQSYFDDENYKNQIQELETFETKYFKAYQIIKNNETELLQNPFIKHKETEFKLLQKNLTEKLSTNWSKISKKVKNPSEIVILESSSSEITALNIFLEKIIEEITIHNLKITNKEKTKTVLIDNFWQIMRWDYDQTIAGYNYQKAILTQEKKVLIDKISTLNADKGSQEQIIKEAQRDTINTKNAIDNINEELKFFGAEVFNIVPEKENSYRIQRPGEPKTSFKTLSEGEKTVISFLYFLEKCKGKETKEEGLTEKIIVIDDPISSLSHIYIFNVAQLIKKFFFGDGCKQVFILTHNLYFFHELVTIGPKEKDSRFKFDGNLFRISRKDKTSITTLKQDEIQNDYQAYWQIIKDHDDGNASDALLANSMRNILEYFFGFISKESLNNAMQRIDKDGNYAFFIRYMSRESHSDTVNISDSKEINPVFFKNAFKEIFDKSGYEEHYNKMKK